MGICAGQGAGVRPNTGRFPCGLVAALALALTAAACTTTTTTSQPTAAASRGPTVAFESIDGPPESVFQRLVQNLSEEAEVRQIAVVSREGPAQYRVRSYVAAQTQGKRSTIAWVWDVYDTEQRRTVRISGEEPASAAGRGTWAVADEAVLKRIAQVGMDRLTAFLASPEARPGVAPPLESPPAMTVAVQGDDFAPESSGIFREAAPANDTPAPSAATTIAQAQPVPLPRRRPSGIPAGAAGSLAYLDPEAGR